MQKWIVDEDNENKKIQREWAWKRMKGSIVFTVLFVVVVIYSFKKEKQKIFDDHK